MKTQTQTQIQAEIAKLKKMKPDVLHYSKFGENHHAAIDAQVDVLENDREESDIYDEHETDNVLEAALECRRWMDGEEDESPSTGWEELVQKKGKK